MVDFSVFDSILDAAFVVDGGGKVVYCNDAAASLCQTSIRRVAGKALLADLITVEAPGLLPFNENSEGRLTPTAFIETVFTVPKAAKTGKAQLAVRPVDSAHWVFFIRDVSLEEALYAKFRSELAQKEDYARNLEKLVEKRTAELREVNQTLNAILDSLGQGFFTFNVGGDCGSVFTKACAEILEGIPKDRKAWDVLGVPAGQIDQFKKWTESLFGEFLPFDDLKGLGPGLFPHSGNKHVTLEYYPIRREENAVRDVVVVATDKTAEFEAQKALEAERQYASMIVKYLRNKEQFLQFLASVRFSLNTLDEIAAKPMGEGAISESFRVLHTVEGEAATFSLRELRQLSRVAQQALEPYKNKQSLPDSVKPEYLASLNDLRGHYELFLRENNNVFHVPEGAVSRMVEISLDTLSAYLSEMKRAGISEKLTGIFQDLFMRMPIGDRLRYFDSVVQGVAERTGKKVKPLAIDGGQIRIFPEPYRFFFSGLVHAFRNSVDHGIEPPEEREWGGKDPAGLIRVHVSLSEKRLLLSISDDGGGIDPKRIREKLREKFPDRDFSGETDEEIIQNICLPGFSSREAVGEFSGRGVGLDALREEVLKLGGTLHIKSTVGQGTALEICLPELGYEFALLRSA